MKGNYHIEATVEIHDGFTGCIPIIVRWFREGACLRTDTIESVDYRSTCATAPIGTKKFTEVIQGVCVAPEGAFSARVHFGNVKWSTTLDNKPNAFRVLSEPTLRIMKTEEKAQAAS